MSARTIATDHWVRTADGAIGRVRYVYENGTADVGIDGEADDRATVNLPLAELRRIVDPYRQLPPIDGLPAERPRCAFCDRKLRPITTHERRKGLIDWTRPAVVRRQFIRWDSYDGLFCRLVCARQFACAAHRAGYRIVRGSK